jgi:hypothetical protein
LMTTITFFSIALERKVQSSLLPEPAGVFFSNVVKEAIYSSYY